MLKRLTVVLLLLTALALGSVIVSGQSSYVKGTAYSMLDLISKTFVGRTGTALKLPHVVWGTQALTTGGATVTLTGGAIFTSSSTYSCFATDQTSAAAVSAVPTAANTFDIVGTGSDTIAFICGGY